MIRLAVFGQPVAQSLSPRIHGLFADQFGLDIDYRAIEATPETFTHLVSELAASGGRGCNVTVPFKNAAWRLARRCSQDADRAEAANTLLFEKDGWFADSTDGGGLVGDLQAGLGFSLAGRRICLLGAGGAAGSVLAALLRQEPENITIANRTAERATALAMRHADLGPVEACALEKLRIAGPFDLVVNATSLGHGGAAPGIRASLFAENALCYDMNYGAAAAPLRHRCGEIGIAYSDGLGMLVGQAALSFTMWTGHAPETRSVLENLRAAPGK